MKISAYINNSYGEHHVALTTDDNVHSIQIPPKAGGFGSSTNGGELLFLALATCYAMTSTAKPQNSISPWSGSKWK